MNNSVNTKPNMINKIAIRTEDFMHLCTPFIIMGELFEVIHEVDIDKMLFNCNHLFYYSYETHG